MFRGHPLGVYGVPEMVFIDGQLYFSREQDLQRQQAIDAEKLRAGRPKTTTDQQGARRDR